MSAFLSSLRASVRDLPLTRALEVLLEMACAHLQAENGAVWVCEGSDFRLVAAYPQEPEVAPEVLRTLAASGETVEGRQGVPLTVRGQVRGLLVLQVGLPQPGELLRALGAEVTQILFAPSAAPTVVPAECPECGEPLAGASECGACGFQPPPPSQDLPGGTLLLRGSYRVEGVLGRGGFGVTYLGTDLKLQRCVAIKEFFPPGCTRRDAQVLPTGWNAPAYQQARQSFFEEGRVMGRFDHPNLVRVHAAFEENNTAYIVMEWVRGRSLREAMEAAGGRLAEAEAVAHVVAVARALEPVHQAGLLHRDVKPDNILASQGRTVLADFGAAREFAPGLERTVIFTPGYAPLEQCSQKAECGPSTDVYALAATLYHLLSGTAPLPAVDRVHAQMPDLAGLRPEVSRRVQEAVRAGLAMDRAARPQSAGAFATLLGTSSPPQRTPGRAPGLAVAGLLLAAALGLAAWTSRPSAPDAPATLQATGDLQAVLDAAPSNATVVLEGRDYRLREPLRITRSVHLRGQGVDAQGTYLSCVRIDALGPVLRATGATPLRLEGISFEYLAEGQGVRVENLHARVDRCAFQGRASGAASATGLTLVNCTGSVTACNFTGNHGPGLVADAACALTISRNNAILNQGSGLVYRGARGQVEDNTCSLNQGSGIEAGDVVVRHNTCVKNLLYGIRMLAPNMAGGRSDNSLADNEQGDFGPFGSR